MRLAVTTLLALILFAAGAAGTYFLMPALAPEDVIVARRYQDSIRAVLDSANTSVRAAALTPDTLRSPIADVLEQVRDDPDEPRANAQQAAETPTQSASVAIAAGDAEAEAAEAERIAGEQAQTERAREIAGVLTKLEDAELRAIVAHLDPDILQSVYQQASARGKTKLLQAIPPEQAALFVRALVRSTDRTNG